MEFLILYTTDTTTWDTAYWTAASAAEAKQEFVEFLADIRRIPKNSIYILGIYVEVTL